MDGAQSAGWAEREAAIAFYGDPVNRGASYPFNTYRAKDVRSALQRLFDGKCAYCETFYASSSPADVDHYRPKGEVSNADGTVHRPGYYWLAADWNNLLPACPDCNRARYHDYPSGLGLTGKASSFPLVDESKRASRPGEEDDEEPILLDPCRDDPDEHLEFIDDGMLRPATLNGSPSQRGEVTIAILGLLRPWLIRGRRDRLIVIDRTIARFLEAVERLDREPDNASVADTVRDEANELKRLIGPSAPYAGMARQRIEPVLRRFGLLPDA